MPATAPLPPRVTQDSRNVYQRSTDELVGESCGKWPVMQLALIWKPSGIPSGRASRSSPLPGAAASKIVQPFPHS